MRKLLSIIGLTILSVPVWADESTSYKGGLYRRQSTPVEVAVPFHVSVSQPTHI